MPIRKGGRNGGKREKERRANTHPEVVDKVHGHIGTAIRPSYYHFLVCVYVGAYCTALREDAERDSAHNDGALYDYATKIYGISIRAEQRRFSIMFSCHPRVASGTSVLGRRDTGQLVSIISVCRVAPQPFLFLMPRPSSSRAIAQLFAFNSERATSRNTAIGALVSRLEFPNSRNLIIDM